MIKNDSSAMNLLTRVPWLVTAGPTQKKWDKSSHGCN